MTYTVRISTIEIYNEHLFDLLSFSSNQEKGTPVNSLALFESNDGLTHIRGLTMRIVANSEETLNLLFER